MIDSILTSTDNLFGDPVEKAERAISMIEKHEATVGAFVAYDAQSARARARSVVGPLAGLTLGVKDIIDTCGFPTEYGSAIYANHRPPADAPCVTLLEVAGAVVMGKTVTTEFAFFRPGKTRNPHNLAHTPGGSSSGSAAAVACGMVDVALGSQTAASLTRPASYCGVVGFKPTFGRYNTFGVKALAPSFDCLGVLGACVETVAAVNAVLSGPVPQSSKLEPQAPCRIGVCRTPWWSSGDSGMWRAFDAAAATLGAEVHFENVALDDFADMADLHATIMSYEAAQSLAWEYRYRENDLSPQITGLIEKGKRVEFEAYRKAQVAAESARHRICTVFDRYDLLLAPAAPGEAPLGLEATGDPIFSRMWTLLHLPSITLPSAVGPQGLPIGIQLLARAETDTALLEYAAWAQNLLPTRPIPTPLRCVPCARTSSPC
jgi:Asp-tRNA(Asn)/Glu-tRNA(Gln) amidotransferase A subunit family amidase